MADTNGARDNQRHSRLLRGTVTLATGQKLDLLIKNISRHGIGAKCPGHGIKMGDSIRIDIPNFGSFQGTVRWRNNDLLGIQISDDLDPEMVHFQNRELTAKENTQYHVPERFQPSASTYRPGFKKR